MDIRIINNKNRLLKGLISLISEKCLCECTTADIIERADISKKTFYNYFKNKQGFLNEVELYLLHGLQDALEKDRRELKNIKSFSLKDISEKANSAFSKTLEFCDYHKDELSALLSSNGDMHFYRAIVKLANDEFDERALYLFDLDDTPHKHQNLFNFFRIIYVDVIINLLTFWLNHKETMSLNDVKYLAGLVQTKSPFELMQLFAQYEKQA